MKVLEKVKNFSKAKKLAITTTVATVATAIPVLAEETVSASGATLSATMASSLQQAVTDFVSMVGVVLPIGLTVFACTFAVKKGMNFFKSITKN